MADEPRLVGREEGACVMNFAIFRVHDCCCGVDSNMQ